MLFELIREFGVWFLFPIRKILVRWKYRKFYKLFPFDFVIAGGTLRDFFSGKGINKAVDVDIFFLSEDDVSKARRWLDEQVNGDSKLRGVISESIFYHIIFGHNVNFIFYKIYDNLEHVVNSFDFTVCSVGLHYNKLYYHYNFLKHLQKRVLFFNILRFGVFGRLVKYKRKGFNVQQYQLTEAIKLMNTYKIINDDYHNISIDPITCCKELGVSIVCKVERKV